MGKDTGLPVSQDDKATGSGFTATVKGVQIAVGEDAVSVDHLVKPEETIQLAMVRQ